MSSLEAAARPINVLAGRELEFVQLGHAIVLGFSGGRRVVIESVAHLCAGPLGDDVLVEPGYDSDDSAASDALAVLLGDVVREARAGFDGELRISFARGAELRIDADADAESWAVTGPDDFLIVCMPGGELAAWGGATAGA
ncbi:hypothetical protein FB565_008108 [Actinoplanes lutulentus]|uniref:Uncharacterized protein n=1 Tax=Actinoplanes lutulentus TaxID=1287878 RepID=A0A327Z3Q1_9ACTN|nr:DUF6188 family protein [Actinoplanes lutulentus]MBB2948325.1 hypothetical protein [Actinoplanes lutulentus]RAK30357.1 hypothetical protein B0I29_11616 [Actinoplanes lutulentus]